MKTMHRPGSSYLVLASMIILIVLVSVLALGPGHHALAAHLSFNTCRNALPQEKVALCNGSDPIGGSCAQDAITRGNEQPIWLGNQRVGLAQVRYSPSCQTAWGRGFSFVPGTTLVVYLPALGIGDAASFLALSSSIYSNMVYTPLSDQFPTVTIRILFSPTVSASATIKGDG